VTIVVGFFSQDPTPGYPPGTAHLSTLTLHGWGWAVYSVLSALLTLFFMALFGMTLQSGGAAGLFERLATSTETIWGVLLLIRLWTGTKFMQPPT
jgi:hypothetical protein